MLPYQVSLFRAIDALDAEDLDLAESSVNAYFAGIESDSMFASARRQLSERQVFEADFVSTLLTEEIDAWCVLTVVNMSRNNWEAAHSHCLRQLELMDQHYGHKTPSIGNPERVPDSPELQKRFLLTASHLAIIYHHLNDSHLSEQWNGVSTREPAHTSFWETSNARFTDMGQPPGLSKFEFSDWSIRPVEKDGTTWLTNMYSYLPNRASPSKFNTLLKVHLPTEPDAEIPSKALRWQLWRLRQLLAMRFQEAESGIFFGELQSRGQRLLLFYVQNENVARRLTADIAHDAAELSPRFSAEIDSGWKEYAFWSGRSIGTSPSAISMPDAAPEESENDRFLRNVWSEYEDSPNLWQRMYDLLWMLDCMPPQSVPLKNYCVEYLFELLDSLTEEERPAGLWHMVWMLPNTSVDAALRALDLVAPDDISEKHQCTANLAAEALAELAPLQAYTIVERLKKVDYSLIHKAAGLVAKSIVGQDQQRARQIVADTRGFIISSSEQPFSKATYLGELADTVGVTLPDAARELLLEAMSIVPGIDERNTRSQVLHELAHAAKNVAPDLLEAVCEGALQAAFALSAPSTGWMDFGGPRNGIVNICWLVPYFAAYSKTKAVEVLNQAVHLTLELADEERFDLIPQLVIAGLSIGAPENQRVAERLWNVLAACSSRNDGPIVLRAASPKNLYPVVDFFRMNPEIAVRKLDTILAMCDGSGSSERQIDVLCLIALGLSSNRDAAQQLLERAALTGNKCSSKYLRALSLMKVVHAMQVLELDSLGVDALQTGAKSITLVELEQDVNNIFDKVNSVDYGLLVEQAAYFAPLDTRFAERCIDKIIKVASFDVAGFEPRMIGSADRYLSALPHDLLCKLFFALAKPKEQDYQQSTSLKELFRVFGAPLNNARQDMELSRLQIHTGSIRSNEPLRGNQ